MPINENELLELNADLMVLIREKQEQGALADAVRLVVFEFVIRSLAFMTSSYSMRIAARMLLAGCRVASSLLSTHAHTTRFLHKLEIHVDNVRVQ